MKVRFAVTPTPDALDERSFDTYLERCEGLGFDTLWLSDIPLGPHGDPLVALGYAAARTRRLKLGANVVPLGRNPLGLAKQLAQLDRLSQGRLLLTFVPGLGSDEERAALGVGKENRGRRLEEALQLLRRWWAGETVTATCGGLHFEGVSLGPGPVQEPLEVWLGGRSRVALERAGRCGDGWLGAFVAPSEAVEAREQIERSAAEAGRVVDPEHFGMSVLVARAEPADAMLEALRRQRSGGAPRVSVPVGAAATRQRVEDYCAAGISKFVVRPLETGPGGDWRADLDWLAETLLPLQS